MEIIFLSDVLLTAIALIWLSIATVQDIKKREVANWLNFSLVIIALAVRAIASIVSSQAYYFLYALLSFAIFFILANVFYYARIFAGGDAKLLIALATIFATTPSFILKRLPEMTLIPVQLPFLLIFVLNMLFVGSTYGIVWSVWLASTHFRAFKKEFKKQFKRMKLLQIMFILLAVLLLSISILLKGYLLDLCAIVVLVSCYFLIFVKAVENSCMVKDIGANEITEGDWLFKKVRIGKRMIMPEWGGLNSRDIALIKKSKIKIVKIKQGLPFVPVFLIALIISFFANILIFLVRLFA